MLKLIGTPAYRNHLAALATLGVLYETRGDALVERADAAGDAMHLARELEFVSAQTYEVLTDPIKGRMFVDFTTIPDGAETFAYDMWDRLAMAEWITNYASAVGAADRFKKRFYKPMYDFGSSYHFSVQDLQKAAFAGTSVDRERGMSARIAHEQFLDNLIAVGDSDRGIEGLCNSTAFQEVQSTVGEWDFTDAEPTDPDLYEAKSIALYNDMHKLCDAIEQNSAENFTADHLLMPLSSKPVLTRRYSRYDSRSRLQVFVESRPGVKVEFWKRLNTASAEGGPKALAYKKSKMVLEFILAYDFRELPPQVEGYTYQILTHARVGGLVVRYALGTARMDLDEDLTP
jgi:hypothetical protein